MWATYEPYADPDFPQGFAHDVDGRFWEMYLGCTLLEAGRALLPVVECPDPSSLHTPSSWRRGCRRCAPHTSIGTAAQARLTDKQRDQRWGRYGSPMTKDTATRSSNWNRAGFPGQSPGFALRATS